MTPVTIAVDPFEAESIARAQRMLDALAALADGEAPKEVKTTKKVAPAKDAGELPKRGPGRVGRAAPEPEEAEEDENEQPEPAVAAAPTRSIFDDGDEDEEEETAPAAAKVELAAKKSIEDIRSVSAIYVSKFGEESLVELMKKKYGEFRIKRIPEAQYNDVYATILFATNPPKKKGN